MYREPELGEKLLFLHEINVNLIGQASQKSELNCYIRIMEPLDSREDRAILHSRPAQVNIDLLLEWINICKEHHTLQLKGTVEEHAMRPNVSLFAVDVSKMCITQLPDLGQYAALSYVWGPSGRQLKWTADTNDRLQPALAGRSDNYQRRNHPLPESSHSLSLG
jgi:hypothetical protein